MLHWRRITVRDHLCFLPATNAVDHPPWISSIKFQNRLSKPFSSISLSLSLSTCFQWKFFNSFAWKWLLAVAGLQEFPHSLHDLQEVTPSQHWEWTSMSFCQSQSIQWMFFSKLSGQSFRRASSCRVSKRSSAFPLLYQCPAGAAPVLSQHCGNGTSLSTSQCQTPSIHTSDLAPHPIPPASFVALSAPHWWSLANRFRIQLQIGIRFPEITEKTVAEKNKLQVACSCMHTAASYLRHPMWTIARLS